MIGRPEALGDSNCTRLGPACPNDAAATSVLIDRLDRISQELEAEGLLDCLGGKGEYRVIYSLSAAGTIAAEKIGYEKSSLAARRKVTAVAGESAREAAKGFRHEWHEVDG